MRNTLARTLDGWGGRLDTTTIAMVGWALTLLVALAGWIVGAIIAARGRRDAFRLEVIEHARRELAPNITAYQRWIGALGGELSFLDHLRLIDQNPVFPANYVATSWRTQRESLEAVLRTHDEALAMFRTLEDYEVVFPQTREIRLTLIQFHGRLVHFASQALGLVTSNMPFEGAGVLPSPDLTWLAVVQAAVPAYYDMQALCEDIRIGVQNATLARIMDANVPDRQPGDPGVPRVLAQGDVWRLQNSLPELPVL